MSEGFFNQVMRNPALLREVLHELRAAGLGDAWNYADVRAIVDRAQREPALKATVVDALRTVADRHGIAFTEPSGSHVQLSDTDLARVVGGASSFPISQPDVLLWIAASLIAIPGVFKESGSLLMPSQGGTVTGTTHV
jgi:hypothetical protein